MKTNKEAYHYTPQYILDSDAKDTEKIITSKYDFDLYNKDKDIVHDVFRVKSEKTSWLFMKNNKQFLEISYDLFSNDQLKQLKSVNGFTKLLSICKSNPESASAIDQIKNWLTEQA